MTETTSNSVELATELTIAWLQNAHNRVSADDVPAFIQTMFQTVEQLRDRGLSTQESDAVDAPTTAHTPAVSVRKSLASPDHIISMIDGKPYRALRRHLSSNGLTPDEYRARYKLKPDYPMVAPGYSEARRAMARKIGLGSKGRAARAATGAAAKPARKPRANSKKS